MTSMIRLRTLGDCTIEVGETRIGPDSAVLFAFLLYLAMERGQPIPRARLRELLWADVPEKKAWHSLRQLLYRARRLGVEIESIGGHIHLDEAAVRSDFEAFEKSLRHAQPSRLSLSRSTCVFLAGLDVGVSAAFREWLENRRSIIHARLREALLTAIANERQSGAWDVVDRLSRHLLELDPYNEEATLSLAEATALAGSKLEAVAILDRYSAELGSAGRGTLSLPSAMLRRRIAERLPDPPRRRPLEGPFVGRHDTLAFLQRRVARVRSGHSAACYLSGPAGIGKTRLLEEFLRTLILQGITVERVNCRVSDRTRPMAVFGELVPKLLRIPGALGCAPETLSLLRGFASPIPRDAPASTGAGEAQFLAVHVRTAVLDLLDALSQENSLALVIEDLHFSDPHSVALLEDISAWAGSRPLLLICTSREAQAATESISWHRLRPLESAETLALIQSLLKAPLPAPSPDDTLRLVRLSEGNPFYARELVSQWIETQTLTTLPQSLTTLVEGRLRTLEPSAVLTLQAIALLEGSARPQLVEAALAFPTHLFVSSLQQLEEAGLVSDRGGNVACSHDLIAEVATRDLGNLARQSLHRALATALENEASHAGSADFVWACARHWSLGGMPERALDFGLQCATQLLSLGLARDAAAMLAGLHPICLGNARRADLLELQAFAHYQAMEWDGVFAALSEKRGTHTRSLSDVHAHNREELMWLEAAWRSDPTSYQPLLVRGRDCVRCTSAPTEHRLAAAVECLKMAGNSCDVSTSESIYADLNDIGPLTRVEMMLRAEADMIHHTLFGDVAFGAAAASRLIELRRGHCGPSALFGTLLNAGFPLLFGSRRADGQSVLLEALQIAKDHRLEAAVFLVFDNLVVFNLHANDFEAAQYWYEQAQPALQRAPAFQRIAFEACGVEILLARGRVAEAQTLWRNLDGKSIPDNFPRGVAAFESVRVRMQLAAGNTIPDEQVQHLEALHLKLRDRGGHDRVAAALILALNASHQRSRASQLYVEYVRHHRREQTPLADELVGLGHDLLCIRSRNDLKPCSSLCNGP